jgi:hypothetical protein
MSRGSRQETGRPRRAWAHGRPGRAAPLWLWVSAGIGAGLAGCTSTQAPPTTPAAPTTPASSASVAPPPSAVAEPAEVATARASSPAFAPTKATARWIVNLVDHTDQYQLAALPDGGLVVAGESAYGVSAKDDLFVTRLTAKGETVWQHLGVGRRLRDLVAAPNTVLLSTEFSGVVNVAGGSVRATAGSTDLFVGRLDLDGKLLGGRVYATPEFDRVARLAPVPGDSGAVILAHGAFVSAPAGGPPDKQSPDAQRIVFQPRGAEDSLVSRLGPTGKIEWTQNIGTGGYDEPEAVAVTPDGDILVVGTRWQSQSAESEALDRNACEGYVTRLGPDGTPKWSTSLSSLSDHTKATSLHLTKNGQLVVRGTLDRPAPIGTVANDARRGRSFRARLDEKGAVLEQKAQDGITCAAVHPSGDATIVAHLDKDKTTSDQNGLYREDDDGSRALLLPFEGETVVHRCAFSPSGDLLVTGRTRPGGKLGGLTLGPPRTVRSKSVVHTYEQAFVGALTF